MISKFILAIIIFLFTSILSLCVLYTALDYVFYHGMSKTRRRKLEKPYSLWQRLKLKHILENIGECRRSPKTLKSLLCLHKVYCFIETIYVLVIIIGLLNILPKGFVYSLLLAKIIVVDGLVLGCMFLNTKHGKNGGVVWRGEED